MKDEKPEHLHKEAVQHQHAAQHARWPRLLVKALHEKSSYVMQIASGSIELNFFIPEMRLSVIGSDYT